MAWTSPTTRSTGDLISASIWNTDLVNNLSYLKGVADNSALLNAANTFTVAGGNALAIQPSTATAAPLLAFINTGGTGYVGIDNSTGGSFGAGNYVTLLYGPAASGLALIASHASGGISFRTGSAVERMTLSSAGVVTVSGFGSHAFSTGAVGQNTISIVNTNSSTTSLAALYVGTDASASQGRLFAFSTAYTSSGAYTALGVTLEGNQSGGVSIAATHASGTLKLYTGGTTLRWGVNAAGDVTFGASSHISDSSGTPSIASGGGTSPSIAGTDYAFKVTLGTSPGTTDVVINFGHTFSTAPVAVGNRVNGGNPNRIEITTSTTQLTIKGTDLPFATGDVIHILARGY